MQQEELAILGVSAIILKQYRDVENQGTRVSHERSQLLLFWRSELVSYTRHHDKPPKKYVHLKSLSIQCFVTLIARERRPS